MIVCDINSINSSTQQLLRVTAAAKTAAALLKGKIMEEILIREDGTL